MNRCPICGKTFEFEDVLFFGTRNSVGAGGAKRQPSKTMPAMGASKSGSMNMSFNMGMGGFFGATPAPKPKEEPAVEAVVEEAPQTDSDIHYAQWAEDAVHMKFMKDSGFWHGDEDSGNGKKTERFIVRWSAEDCAPGTAKADIMAKNANVPTTVTLCEEDQAKYGKGPILASAMCPHCHCSIDPTYFSIPNENCHTISLIGYPSCGKTEFKLALVEELSKLEDSFELCDSVELTIDSKKMTFNELLYFRDGEAEATDPEKLVFPVVFMVKNKVDSSMHLITLCDMPGEFYRDVLDGMKEKLASNESLKKCDAAILMIGASQLFSACRYDKKIVLREDPESGTTEKTIAETQYVPVENGKSPYITDPLKFFNKYEVCKHVRHMALVVTKGDLLIGKEGKGIADKGEKDPLLKQMKICQSDESRDHKAQVSVRVLNQVDEETMRSIRKSANYREKESIKDEICKKIDGELRPENIRASVISTLRRPNPEKAEFFVVDDSAYPRHRILEPILYLMAQWGAVPRTSEPWGMGSNGACVLMEEEANEAEPAEEHVSIIGKLFGRKKKR